MEVSRSKSRLMVPSDITGVTIQFEYLERSEIETLVGKTLDADRNFRRYDLNWVRHLCLLRAVGDWQISPLPVVLSTDGCVLDGMHRLNSELKSGSSGGWYLVVRNWPEKLDKGIDHNKPRTAQQWLNNAHSDWNFTISKRATTRATIFGAFVYPSKHGLLVSDLERAYMTARTQIETVSKWFTGKQAGLGAGVRAAFIRAIFSGPNDQLRLAAEVLKSGSATSTGERRFDTMVVLSRTLRSHALVHPGGERQSDEYRKTSTAIVAFMRGSVLTRIVPTKQESFPNPALDAIREDILTRP